MKINLSRNRPNLYKSTSRQQRFKKKTWMLENAGGVGVKTTQTEDKLGAKFALKLMYEEFHQIQAKVQVNNGDFENQLGY